MCAAWRAPDPSAALPGRIVSNVHQPSSLVPSRPKPVNAGGAASGVGGGLEYRPSASACQISTIESETGAPSPSSTRTRRWMCSPGVSGVASLPSRSVAPGPTWKKGPIVCEPVATSADIGSSLMSGLRTASSLDPAGRCRSGSRAPTRAASESRSKRETSRWRARSSGIDWKMGSNGNSGSFGKYICVTMRDAIEAPKSEKWMCAGRQAFG